MIDTLLRFREAAQARRAAAAFGLEGQDYAVLTLHRPDNVDAQGPLGQVLDAVVTIGKRVPVVFPVHPRTRKQLQGTEMAVEVPDLVRSLEAVRVLKLARDKPLR